MPAAASPASPFVLGIWNRQIRRPDPASRATTSLTLVTYITPCTTTGVVCRRSAPCIANIQTGASRLTLAGVI
jgi:hypothetical protein